MRTQTAIKVKLCQLKNILPYRVNEDERIILNQIELLEWILNLDKRSIYLKKLNNKKRKLN